MKRKKKAKKKKLEKIEKKKKEDAEKDKALQDCRKALKKPPCKRKLWTLFGGFGLNNN